MLNLFSSANITKCHFSSNHAPGDGGAIYVTMKSELRVSHSEFVQNTATNGGSLGVYLGHCVIVSSNFTYNNASNYGGCVSLIAANVTIKRSKLSGCKGKIGGSVSIRQQSSLQLEEVTISNSYAPADGALRVDDNSDLFLKDSMMTGCHSDVSSGGILCSDKSRVYLESVLIRFCSSSVDNGCVYGFRCNVTMDNITFTDTDSAITVFTSTTSIFNSLVLNDITHYLWTYSSHVAFGNCNISDTSIQLYHSVTEFRHILFVNLDNGCPIEDDDKSNIMLESVDSIAPTDITQSESTIVCKGPGTVVEGNTSGKPSVQKSC